MTDKRQPDDHYTDIFLPGKRDKQSAFGMRKTNPRDLREKFHRAIEDARRIKGVNFKVRKRWG